MDHSQLPNIDDVLVTVENPARDPSLGRGIGMDHARCAALHNYLVRYAWLADGRPADTFPEHDSFFNVHSAAAEALRPRLHPSLAYFLSAAIHPARAHEPPVLFFWVAGLSGPHDVFGEKVADLFDQPEDSVLCLYPGWASGAGLFYHQIHHRSTFFEDMTGYDFALPVRSHQDL